MPRTDSRFDQKYSMHEQARGGWVHTWQVVCRRGAVHFHATEHDREMAERINEKFSGGVEVHYLEPFAPDKSACPDHNPCPFLKQPCWHDGSSLLAFERFIPLLQDGVGSIIHETIFGMLRSQAIHRFWGEEE